MSETKMSHAKTLAVCAICIALAFVLNQISLFRMPNGGSISPGSMIFIALAGYWLGPKYGIVTGVVMGILHSLLGGFILNPVQGFLDYPAAYGMIGLSGFFRKWKFGLQIGYVVGVAGRFLMAFLAGMIFFIDIAETGGIIPSIVFSAIYNITYIGPELAVSLVIISLPTMKHAIDMVTKSVVPHSVYLELTKNKGSATVAARLTTGAVIGIFGGFAFVIASHLTRLENLIITEYVTGATLFTEPHALIHRGIPRMIARYTASIPILQAVGVVFLAVGITLLFSTLAPQKDSK